MILLGLGGNLPFRRLTSPRQTLEAVLAAVAEDGVEVLARSRWYETAPVAAEPQPWYVNGVAALGTGLPPDRLMALLLQVEARFGRVRSRRDAPRTVDLDLLAYHDLVLHAEEPALTLPHPRLHQRAFVLRPLLDVAPDWRHPVLQRPARDLLEELPPDQVVRPLG